MAKAKKGMMVTRKIEPEVMSEPIPEGLRFTDNGIFLRVSYKTISDIADKISRIFRH